MKAFDAEKVLAVLKERIQDQNDLIQVAQARRDELMKLQDELQRNAESGGYLMVKDEPKKPS